MNLLNFLRFTGKDYLDHAINALLMFSAISALLIWLSPFTVEVSLTIALCSTVLFGGIFLEAYQNKSGTGKAQASDYGAVIISAVFCYITAFPLLLATGVTKTNNWYFKTKWYELLGMYILLAVLAYVWVYRRLRK